MKTKLFTLNEQGVSFLDTLFVVSILSVLSTAAILYGSSIYRNALLKYETQMLVSDIKLLQAMSGTARYDQTNFPTDETPPPPLTVYTTDRLYQLRSIYLGGPVLRTHFFPPPIRAYCEHAKYISFLPNGSTTSNTMGSINLNWKPGNARYRVVIDAAGRVRVDR